jgi:hypothetical protein
MSEPTDTFVFTYKDHFVDIRSYKTPTATQAAFPFDWVFYGQVVRPADGGEPTYTHTIDSRYINALATLGEEKAQIYLLPDNVNTVENEQGDEVEVGEMLNPDTMDIEKFVEIWRPLDPLRGSQKTPIGRAELYDHDFNDDEKSNCLVLLVETEGFKGKLIKIGSWAQAFLQDTSVDGVAGLTVVRAAKVDGTEEWKHLILWGAFADSVPVGSDIYAQFNTLGASVTVNKLIWKRIL